MLTINELNAYNMEENREDTLYYVLMLTYRKDCWARGIKECETTDGVMFTTNDFEDAKKHFDDVVQKNKDELVEITIQQAERIYDRNVEYEPVLTYSKFEEMEREEREYNRKKELLEYLGFEDYDIDDLEEDGSLTLNNGRDNQDYIWYFDDCFNACINIESGEILDGKHSEEDNKKIEELFC